MAKTLSYPQLLYQEGILEKAIPAELERQQKIYKEVLHPSASVAKLRVAGIRTATRVLPKDEAKFLEHSQDPTARFEWARSEIDSISRNILSMQRKLEKVRAELPRAKREGLVTRQKGL